MFREHRRREAPRLSPRNSPCSKPRWKGTEAIKDPEQQLDKWEKTGESKVIDLKERQCFKERMVQGQVLLRTP